MKIDKLYDKAKEIVEKENIFNLNSNSLVLFDGAQFKELNDLETKKLILKYTENSTHAERRKIITFIYEVAPLKKIIDISKKLKSLKDTCYNVNVMYIEGDKYNGYRDTRTTKTTYEGHEIYQVRPIGETDSKYYILCPLCGDIHIHGKAEGFRQPHCLDERPGLYEIITEMNDEIKEQIYMYCEAVKAGSKPVAMMSLQTRYIDKAKEITTDYGLNLYVENVKEDENWKVIFIYKHKYLIDIIKNVPDSPMTIYEHWILGKLFGYSDNAIDEFVSKLES